MTEINIHAGDAVKWANEYEGELFHALLCDSPYHLTSIVKRFGKVSMEDDTKTSDKVRRRADGYSRLIRTGFMGQSWDGGDVAFRPETWAAFMKVLHPGAFGMTFAGSRGWHRLAVAIEGYLTLTPNQLLTQADLLAVAREKKDWAIVEDVENALREMAGVQNAITQAGFIIHPSIFGWSYSSGFPKATNPSEAFREERGVVRAWKGKTISNDAMLNLPYSERLYWYQYEKEFKGSRYGLQALKPALEPIIVFQKPYAGRPLDCIRETGAGTLNIEAGRIETNDDLKKYWSRVQSVNQGHYDGLKNINLQEYAPNGRWPSNFILLDEQAAAALDRQSGTFSWKIGNTEFIDECGASRFFFRVQEKIDDADLVYYEAKAGTDEREAGLRELPKVKGGAMTGAEMRHNSHPTLKPLSLTRYLASLLLPPAAYAPRRIFVPFAGVASEMIGAMQAGWDVIDGVELTEKYIPIAEARIEYWRNRGWQMEMEL